MQRCVNCLDVLNRQKKKGRKFFLFKVSIKIYASVNKITLCKQNKAEEKKKPSYKIVVDCLNSILIYRRFRQTVFVLLSSLFFFALIINEFAKVVRLSNLS